MILITPTIKKIITAVTLIDESQYSVSPNDPTEIKLITNSTIMKVKLIFHEVQLGNQYLTTNEIVDRSTASVIAQLNQ